MNIVPIVFAFDNNLAFPACICLSSLMMNAKESTFYDIFILHPASEELEHEELDKIPSYYPTCKIQYIAVDDTFAQAYEIRGITTPAYYRLLIPELIPQYDKILYSDVDVLFRRDLSDLMDLDLGLDYLAAVYDWSIVIDEKGREYAGKVLGINSRTYIQSGFLLMNCKLIREDGLVNRFREEACKRYKFQDQDILNVVCGSRKKSLPIWWNMTNYAFEYWHDKPQVIMEDSSETEIEKQWPHSNIHYNGQKPWKGWCVNFDIWWEYYRKSPFYDEKFYFNFFYNKLNEHDQLPLWKRVKILLRYFIFGCQQSR